MGQFLKALEGHLQLQHTQIRRFMFYPVVNLVDNDRERVAHKMQFQQRKSLYCYWSTSSMLTIILLVLSFGSSYLLQMNLNSRL